MTDYKTILEKWLLMTKEEIFFKFSEFGGGKSIDRGEGDKRFLYIPGPVTRKDRVVLIAHADMFSDRGTKKVKYDEHNRIFSFNNEGIGHIGDDHAGCAILWELRNLGHSLLITTGKGNSSIACKWLATVNRDISDELNSHNFMVEFDRSDALDFTCYGVGTPEFIKYLKDNTGHKIGSSSITDIRVLCKTVCGVNFSVSYKNEQNIYAKVSMEKWENTLKMAKEWLKQENLPRFSRTPT